MWIQFWYSDKLSSCETCKTLSSPYAILSICTFMSLCRNLSPFLSPIFLTFIRWWLSDTPHVERSQSVLLAFSKFHSHRNNLFEREKKKMETKECEVRLVSWCVGQGEVKLCQKFKLLKLLLIFQIKNPGIFLHRRRLSEFKFIFIGTNRSKMKTTWNVTQRGNTSTWFCRSLIPSTSPPLLCTDWSTQK